MKYKKLLLLPVLFIIVSGCSFIQEDNEAVQLSSDGKLVYSPVESNKSEEAEEAEEPPEPDITNPMPVPEMSAPEMQLRETSLPEMELPEIQLPEMPDR